MKRLMVRALDAVHIEYPRAGVAAVRFARKHDVSTNSAISELLEGLMYENELVVADLSRARFIDLAMLNVLFAAEETARALGKEFRIELGIGPGQDVTHRP